jgi:DNA repair protein RecO (recombination protein O)
MKIGNFDALVLKSINFKDSDKILTLLTKDLGRVSAKAKGIRKINSKRLSFLDTLNYVRLGLVGDGDLKTITEAKLVHSFPNLKKDLDRLNSAYYFIEILNKLIHESDENSEIFELVVKCLKRLDEIKYNDSRVENYFELRLLEYLGYSLDFEKCCSCQKILNFDLTYSFNYESGGLECSECQTSLNYLKLESLKAILYLKGLYKGDDLDFTQIDIILKFYINDLIGGVPKSKKYLDFSFSA